MPASGDVAALVVYIGPKQRSHVEREECARTLAELAARRPDLVLPYWGILAGLLKSTNSFSQCAAADVLAALAGSEWCASPFEDVFDAFFGLLSSGKVMVAGKIATLAGRLAFARPELEPDMTARLLSIGYGKLDPERADLVKGYAIEALSEYWEKSSCKEAIVAFVENQFKRSKSPATKERAAAFLARLSTSWPGRSSPGGKRTTRQNA